MPQTCLHSYCKHEAQQNTAKPIQARISVELLRPHSVGVNLEVALLLGTEPTVHKGVAMISLFEMVFVVILCTPVNADFVIEVQVVDGLEDQEAPVWKIDLKIREP